MVLRIVQEKRSLLTINNTESQEKDVWMPRTYCRRTRSSGISDDDGSPYRLNDVSTVVSLNSQLWTFLPLLFHGPTFREKKVYRVLQHRLCSVVRETTDSVYIKVLCGPQLLTVEGRSTLDQFALFFICRYRDQEKFVFQISSLQLTPPVLTAGSQRSSNLSRIS